MTTSDLAFCRRGDKLIRSSGASNRRDTSDCPWKLNLSATAPMIPLSPRWARGCSDQHRVHSGLANGHPQSSVRRFPAERSPALHGGTSMSISGIPGSILSPYQSPYQLGASTDPSPVNPSPVSPPFIVSQSPVGPSPVSPPIIASPLPVGPSPVRTPIIANPLPVGPTLNQISQNLASSNLSNAQQAYATLQQDRQLSALDNAAIASESTTLLSTSPVSLEA